MCAVDSGVKDGYLDARMRLLPVKDFMTFLSKLAEPSVSFRRAFSIISLTLTFDHFDYVPYRHFPVGF